MDIFLDAMLYLGIVAASVSGALTAIKKRMDLLGVIVLGITTSIFGGIFRDILLGITPPGFLTDYTFALIAGCTAVVVFLPFIRKLFSKNLIVFNNVLFVSDALGLSSFTVYGMKVAIDNGYLTSPYIVVFMGVITAVGGGVMRDIFAGDRPYIFVKHIYALASLGGAIPCYIFWRFIDPNIGIIVGFIFVFAIRVIAYTFKLSLPVAEDICLDDPVSHERKKPKCTPPDDNQNV